MYPALFTTTLVFALAALRVRADFNVASVDLTQCQPATLNWDSTNGPYDVIVVPSDKPCGDPLVDLGDQNSNKFDWTKVNVPAGTKVLISVLDSKDQEGWSGVITVKSSNDNTCLTSPTPPNAPGSNPTIVGAANAGALGNVNGAPMLHFSGAAVAVTAFGALAALL